jgi:dCMP deaminase
MEQLHKWDKRFLRLARETSTWSKDPSTKTGAVIVSPDKVDVILGFNGFPKRMKDSTELYANRETKYSRIIHCEMNALIHSHKSLAGYTLYTWPFLSCDRCAVHMIESGIVHAVAPLPTADQLTRWGKAFELTRSYFEEAGVNVDEVDLAAFSLDD